MNRLFYKLYYPLSQPFPERVGRYRRVLDYRQVSGEKAGSISAVRLPFAVSCEKLAGKKLAFASDFHYAATARDKRVAKDFIAAVQRFQPDYLLLGGDLSSDAADMDKLDELLAPISRCAPVVLVIPGNWERGKSWLSEEYWRAFYGRYKIHFLCNEFWRDSALEVFGVDDISNGYPELPDAWTSGMFHILLVHRPDTVIALDEGESSLLDTDLALCGHTHGGQIRFPFLGSVFAASKYGCKFDYGMFARRGSRMQMFVSSGIGHRSFPLRFNCRRELILIDFSQSKGV